MASSKLSVSCLGATMESSLCILLVLLILLGEPIGHLKTAASSIWLVISFSYFVVEPEQMTKIAAYTRYAFMALVGVIFTYLIAVPLTPIAVLFARSNGYLPRWLSWLQTFDASLDAGWQGGYFAVTGTPTGFALYCLRVRWLWRNPAYGFDLWPLGLAYDPTQWAIKVCDVTNGVLTKFYAVTVDGKHFAYTDSTGKKLGWKLWWALDSNFHLLPAAQYEHVATQASGYAESKRIMFVFTP